MNLITLEDAPSLSTVASCLLLLLLHVAVAVAGFVAVATAVN